MFNGIVNESHSRFVAYTLPFLACYVQHPFTGLLPKNLSCEVDKMELTEAMAQKH